MAKRKRLSPFPGPLSDHETEGGPRPDDTGSGGAAQTLQGGLETKSFFPRYPDGVAPVRSAPIASVAADTAVQAALDEVTGELTRARTEGRMVMRIPLDAIEENYLVRDRIAADPEEMAALTASLRARGQQVPVEVADLGAGRARRYGLISGWRRLIALRRLSAEGAAPAEILAIQRNPAAAAGAYLAMVEENEIRAGLSFYERARVVVRAADNGVFADDRAALSHLFASVPKARRSKIGSFTRIVRAFEQDNGAVQGLFFPTQLSEKLGLVLVAAIDRDPGFAPRLAAALAADPPVAAQVEAARIQEFLRDPGVKDLSPAPQTASAPDHDLPELTFPDAEEALLRGPDVADPRFRKALARWLSAGGWRR